MDKFVGTSKEKFFYHNTLLSLVKTLQNRNITVDLRNDSYVCGMVLIVDGYMNISFGKSVYCDPEGNEYLFDSLFVHGRNIRYVHIPEDISMIKAITNEFVKKPRIDVEKQAKEKSRKAQKALKQHMATVASLKQVDK